MKETVSLQKNVLSRENSKHKSPRRERTWCLKELFQAPGLQTSSEGCFLKLIKFIFHNICPFKVYKSVLFSIHTKLFYFFKVMIWFWFWPRWSMGDLLTWNNQKNRQNIWNWISRLQTTGNKGQWLLRDGIHNRAPMSAQFTALSTARLQCWEGKPGDKERHFII